MSWTGLAATSGSQVHVFTSMFEIVKWNDRNDLRDWCIHPEKLDSLDPNNVTVDLPVSSPLN